MSEFYPVPNFTTLAVRDLAASVRWYAHALDYQALFVMPALEAAIQLFWFCWMAGSRLAITI